MEFFPAYFYCNIGAAAEGALFTASEKAAENGCLQVPSKTKTPARQENIVLHNSNWGTARNLQTSVFFKVRFLKFAANKQRQTAAPYHSYSLLRRLPKSVSSIFLETPMCGNASLPFKRRSLHSIGLLLIAAMNFERHDLSPVAQDFAV